MNKVKITVMKIACYKDLMEKYENPIEHTCDMILGQSFISIDGKKPEGFCDSAWDSVSPFAVALANGEEDFYDAILVYNKRDRRFGGIKK